jgi:hypothetical protein
MNGWTETTTKVETVDASGQPLVLEHVRAYRSPDSKEALVFPTDVMRAELMALAEALRLEPRDIALFAMMYAKPGPFQEGYVHMLYRLNKMLFYQWKGLEEQGFGEALPHDEFDAKERGPVPRHLKEDLVRLGKMGYLKADWPSGKEQQSISCNLTPAGEALASAIWFKLDPLIRAESLRWKRRLFVKTPAKIRERVHKDYPEFRKTFVKPDVD